MVPVMGTKRGLIVEENKRSLIGNQPVAPQQDTPERLEAMMAGYARHGAFAEARKQRLADLMQRRSAKKWSPAKKAQMARRYFEAGQGAEQAIEQVALLRDRLQQLVSP